MALNNNVAKSAKWCLEVVNNDDSDSEISATETHFLNVGKTMIGRNIKADLVTNSEFASRNHCFIELTDSDELFLTDSSSNGTYVNTDHIKKQTAQLKMNDLIGIGCTVDSPSNREVEVGTEMRIYRCYVYKLVNCSKKKVQEEIISLLSDDDENDQQPPNGIVATSSAKNEDEPDRRVTTNGNDYDVMCLLESGDEMLIDCVAAGPSTVNGSATFIDLDEHDDGIEQIQWSQQIALNVKQEAQQCVISDDDDEDGSKGNHEDVMKSPNDNDQEENDNENNLDDDTLTSKWLSRLSQDQDKVKEKTAVKTLQKRAKMIDSMPFKKRRQSVSDRASTFIADPPPIAKRRKSVSALSSEFGNAKPLTSRRKSVSSARPMIKLDGFIKPKRHEADKKDLAECRKAKLLEIAQNQQMAKLRDAAHVSAQRVSTKPKVKLSESRGAFLQEPLENEKKRLISKSEVDEHRKQHQLIGLPSTSKGHDANSTYVDHFDPFAVGLRKTAPENPKRIDDVFAEIDKQYIPVPKKRTARAKSTYVPASDRGKYPASILKTTANGNRAKQLRVVFRDEVLDGKSAQAKELVDLREFEAQENEDVEILVNDIRSAANSKRSEFENNPLHKIINEVTSWDVDWLLKKKRLPPITDADHVITPMLSSYASYEVFQDTITPLLKHELWASIIADTEKDSKCLDNKIHIKFNEVNFQKRGAGVRWVYHCEVAAESAQKVFVGDLVVVSSGISKFFAYVTEQRIIRSGYMRTIAFSMEAAPTKTNECITGDTLSVTVSPISNIRTELKLFSAVYTLKNSAMKQYILNPLAQETFQRPPKIPGWQYQGYDPLNKEQSEILESIFRQCVSDTPGVSLVEGPPGTGKSRLIVNLILQLVFAMSNLRILVCAHSNAAVDIIALKLKKIRAKTVPDEKQKMLKIVRFGVVDSMDRDVQSIALQNLIKCQSSPDAQSPQTQRLLDEKDTLTERIDAMSRTVANADNVSADQLTGLRRRLNQINETLERMKSVKGANGSLNRDERKISHVLMARANIVCTTLSSSINLKQYVNSFDVCIVDEASQCIEPWSMIPLLFDVHSLILVGDSQQLPAVVLSTVGRENNLERSLFTRLQEVCTHVNNKPNIYSLCQQYRMHPEICRWSNQYFYHNRLTSAPCTIDPSFQLNPYGVFSLDFLQSCKNGSSFHNSDEAKFIIDLLKIVVRYADPKRYSYGIITPYSTQRRELQTHINKTRELAAYNFPVNTIDSYQGQEKDIIILSTTRTDGVGFLSNPQRLNVALTRAKRCLLVCGNFQSVKQVRVWNSLLSNATERHLLHTIPRKYTESDLLKMLLRPDALVNDR